LSARRLGQLGDVAGDPGRLMSVAPFERVKAAFAANDPLVFHQPLEWAAV
jgi:hypothetical protein